MSETYGTSLIQTPFEVSLIRRITVFSFVILAAYYILKNDELSWRLLSLVIPLATLTILESKGKKLLTIFFMISLLVFPIFTFLTYYWDESEFAMNQAQYEGLTFLGKNLKDNDVLFMDGGGVINFFTHANVEVITYLYDFYNTTEIWSSDTICYLVSSFARYFYFEGTTENSFVRSRHLSENNPNFNKVYDDMAVQMFNHIP